MTTMYSRRAGKICGGQVEVPRARRDHKDVPRPFHIPEITWPEVVFMVIASGAIAFTVPHVIGWLLLLAEGLVRSVVTWMR